MLTFLRISPRVELAFAETWSTWLFQCRSYDILTRDISQHPRVWVTLLVVIWLVEHRTVHQIIKVEIKLKNYKFTNLKYNNDVKLWCTYLLGSCMYDGCVSSSRQSQTKWCQNCSSSSSVFPRILCCNRRTRSQHRLQHTVYMVLPHYHSLLSTVQYHTYCLTVNNVAISNLSISL